MCAPDIDDGSVIIRSNKTSTRVNFNDTIPDSRKDAGSIRRSLTSDIKKSFKNIFKMNVEKKNGPNSRTILDYPKFVTEPSGTTYIIYRDKKIGAVGKDSKPVLYTRRNGKFVNEFKDKMFDTVKEYHRTPSGLVEDTFGSDLPEDMINSILDSSVERISEKVDDNASLLTEQELREFAGIFDPKGATDQDKIDALEIQADHWRDETRKAEDPKKERLYKSLEDSARLQADNIRLRNNEKPIHDETIQIINNEIQEGDLSRLEKFKRWARKNLVGLSAVAITIAGIITTVVVAGRKALQQTAKTTGKLAKALVNVGKKLGPLIAPILNILAQAITWGAKGIEFLSNNLWLLSIAFAYFLYDAYKNRKT